MLFRKSCRPTIVYLQGKTTLFEIGWNIVSKLIHYGDSHHSVFGSAISCTRLDAIFIKSACVLVSMVCSLLDKTSQGAYTRSCLPTIIYIHGMTTPT